MRGCYIRCVDGDGHEDGYECRRRRDKIEYRMTREVFDISK